MTPSPVPAPPRRASHEAILAIWQELQATGDERLRNKLVLTYSPLVRYIIFKRLPGLPPHCEMDDLISSGFEALITSIDRWDPDKGSTLEQFVWTRIQGAVLDELRRQDWAPRSVRRRERDVARAKATLTGRLYRPPTRTELADELKISADELLRHEHDVAMTDVASLDAKLTESGEDGGDFVATTDGTTDPVRAAEVAAAKERFREVFKTLPRREREVAVMLYVHELPLAEIGARLGVSESRVSQIHSGLRQTLRTQLGADKSLFSAVG